MKKILVSVLVLSLAIAVNAQEIPERKHEKPMMHPGHQGHPGRHYMQGMNMKHLNLTEAQKAQKKSEKESFHKKMEELQKTDNITVKEWRTRKETLHKEQKTKIEAILTAEQKAQIGKMKAEHKAMMEIDAKARMEKMKIHLGLTDEQDEKMKDQPKNTFNVRVLNRLKAIKKALFLTKLF